MLQNVMLVICMVASTWTLLVTLIAPLRVGLSEPVASTVAFGALFVAGALWIATTIEYLVGRR